MLPEVEFAHNASRALGVEHTRFEANFGFSLEEPPGMLFNVRPSIRVSQDATLRLKLLYELHALVHSVFKLHKNEMHDRSKRSTARTSFEETM
jgi:hypothetical protein